MITWKAGSGLTPFSCSVTNASIMFYEIFLPINSVVQTDGKFHLSEHTAMEMRQFSKFWIETFKTFFIKFNLVLNIFETRDILPLGTFDPKIYWFWPPNQFFNSRFEAGLKILEIELKEKMINMKSWVGFNSLVALSQTLPSCFKTFFCLLIPSHK